jgi:hypothetical protein
VVYIFVHGLQSIGGFMATWQLTNIVILKKDDYCTAMFHPIKVGYIIIFSQYASQNNSVFSKLKVVPKNCA